MTTPEQDSWFLFTVRDTGGEGVEVPKLARLLDDLSSAFYAIARGRVGPPTARPGPRTAAEEALAGIRLLRVLPGSATIELAPPPTGAQTHLPLDDSATPDDVALELYEEIERVHTGEPVPSSRVEIRRRVRAVVEAAGQIGTEAEIVYRPRVLPRGATVSVFRTTIPIRDLPSEVPLERSTRRQRYSGHAYMVDVEPGRQRLRIKLPDGRDITLGVDEGLIEKIRGALDRVVEVEAEEELEGMVPSSRNVKNVAVLPSSGPGSDKPPTSVEELQREQGLPKQRPDYVALASAIWQSEEDVRAFEEYLRSARRAGTS